MHPICAQKLTLHRAQLQHAAEADIGYIHVHTYHKRHASTGWRLGKLGMQCVCRHFKAHKGPADDMAGKGHGGPHMYNLTAA